MKTMTTRFRVREITEYDPRLTLHPGSRWLVVLEHDYGDEHDERFAPGDAPGLTILSNASLGEVRPPDLALRMRDRPTLKVGDVVYLRASTEAS